MARTLCCSLILLSTTFVSAQGAWSRECDQPGMGTAGRVFALGTWRNELIAGTYRSPSREGTVLEHLGRFDGERWHAIGGGVNDTVRTVIEFQGDLIVGGEFTWAGNVQASRIARWDGTAWHPMGAGFDDIVWCLGVHQGQLYAGGAFRNSGAQQTASIARWNGSSWQPVAGGFAWNLGQATTVRALASDGTTLYAGGQFDRAGGTPASHVAAFDGTGWRPLGGGVENFGPGVVKAFAFYQGRLYAGGSFYQAGSVQTRNIAAWDGSAWRAVATGVNSATYGSIVHSLQVFGGHLYLGGHFEHAGSLQLPSVARWDGSSFHFVGGVAVAETNPPSVFAMTVWGGRLWCGGEFQAAGEPLVVGRTFGVYHIASFDGQEWRAAGRGLGISADLLMMGRYAGDLVASGAIAFAGSDYVDHLARFDGDDWRFFGHFDGIVRDMVEHQGELWVVGEFRSVNGIVVHGAARWNGTSWNAIGAGPSAYGGNSIAVYQNTVYVGTTGNPVRWNGSSWQTFGASVTGVILDMHVHGGVLYMGGSTAFMPGDPNVFAWDGANFTVVGGGVNGAVEALHSHNGDLIVGGRFTQAGGVPARGIARWNGSQWSSFGGGLAGETVLALATFEGELHAGGGFSRAQGAPADRLARWDGTSWHEVGSGLDGVVHALVADPVRHELHVGGHFHSAGSTESIAYAIWQRDAVWTELGHALGSPRRTPELTGTGRLLPGSTARIAISSAHETSAAVLLVGASRIDTSIFGGVLVPSPDVAFVVPTDIVGMAALEFTWPALPAGTAAFLQGWILDPAMPSGLTATQGLRMRQP